MSKLKKMSNEWIYSHRLKRSCLNNVLRMSVSKSSEQLGLLLVKPHFCHWTRGTPLSVSNRQLGTHSAALRVVTHQQQRLLCCCSCDFSFTAAATSKGIDASRIKSVSQQQQQQQQQCQQHESKQNNNNNDNNKKQQQQQQQQQELDLFPLPNNGTN